MRHQRFYCWFRAPVFPGDEEQTHLAAILHAMLWGLSGYTLLIIPFYLTSVWLPLCALLSIIVALCVLHRGQVFAVRTGMFVLWAGALSILPWFAGGTQALSFHAYSLVIVCAALCCRPRFVMLGIVLYVLNGFALEMAGQHHLLPTVRTIPHPPVFIGLGHSSILIALAVIVNRSYTYLQTIIQQAHQEITERHRVESALREQEQRFRSIVENTAAGYFFIDAEGMIRDVNPAWVRLYKYDSPTEIIGQHFTIIQKLEDVEAAKEFVAGIMQSNPRYLVGEFSRKCKDGSVGYHSFSARPVVQHGVTLGIEGFIIDTTERKQAENALRESEARFRSLFHAMSEGVALHEVLYDETRRPIDYRILNVNPAFEKIVNIPHDQAVGRNASSLYGTASAPYLDIYAPVAAGAPSITFEVYFAPMRKYFNISVVSPERGKFATIFEDITKRKQIEAEIRQLNVALETRVAERTAELETANRELKDFAYVVSHDLKAPLRAISRLAEWLRQDYAALFDEKGHEMVDLLIGRVKRMDNLIEGILEYSRIGRVEGEITSLDLNEILAEVLDSLAPPAHIRIIIAASLPIVKANRTRMAEVFQNLLSNAIKFLDKPQGMITIQCAEETDAWRFSVADNGPGIDPKYHERIFQIFQTLHPRDQVESTGIGLAVVKKIVELYGGRVWVESQVGQGSTFSFTLPRHDSEELA